MQLSDASNTPRRVSHSEIRRFDDLDQRVSAGTVLFGSVFGVNEESIDWVPDDIPPTEQERLAWLWLIDPTRSDDLLDDAHDPLRALLLAYRDDRMQEWWQEIATTGGA